MERSFISRANGSFIYIFQSPQWGALPRKTGKTFGHHPRSPTWTEGLHTMGCDLVPQGDRLRHCNLSPSAMQSSARYLPSWLGWTRAPLASMCRSNSHQGVPSTTVTASQVTHGRVRIHDTPRYGRGFGFMGG